MLETIQTMPIEDRRQLVLSTLRPDEIRNHRVASGLELDLEQTHELMACGTDIALFADGMSEISNIALAAPSADQLMRTIRQLLGTEGIHQAHKRGEISSTTLPSAEITKADIVLTQDGFRVVEIEPGKIRGLGYGVMTRMQSVRPIGVGASASLGRLIEGMSSAIVLSEKDRFHEPEIKILAKAVDGLRAVPQISFTRQQGENPVEALLMMSPLVNNHGITERQLRDELVVLSDRRLDLESKGAIALTHNAGEIPELEDLLLDVFGQDTLLRLRSIIPKAEHIALDDTLEQRIKTSRGSDIFLKPVLDSGTRGIVTPGDAEGLALASAKRKTLAKFIAQEAVETILTPMHSLDVLRGDERDDRMNLRITVHVDRNGDIIESTVVGSPHEHLAHGGKASVITNIEAAPGVIA